MSWGSPPKEILDSIYPPVGALVVAWSILEQSIEFWVALIFHTNAAKTSKLTKRLPHKRAAKIEYLENAFTELEVLGPFADEGKNLITAFENLALVRDLLVHGAITAYNPITKQFKFHRLPIDKIVMKHVITPEYLTIDEIRASGNLILQKMTESLSFGHRLADSMVGK